MNAVDVIVPCYNYGRYLRECVESLLSQEAVDVRILIIDDSSTDDTPTVAFELASQDGRVSYRRHSENHGHIATYNEGLQWASRNYTVLLSADDILTSGALARATAVMEARPDVGFVFGDIIELRDGEPARAPRTTSVNCKWQVWGGLDWLRSVFRNRPTFIVSPEVVARTQMYKTLGGYRKELPHTADVELWLRFAAYGAVGKVEADQAYYRVHGRSMSRAAAPGAFQSLEHWSAAYDAFFDHHGHRLPGGAGLQRLAAESLANRALAAAYSPKHGRDRESREALIDLAVRISPGVRSSAGRFGAGLKKNSVMEPWARRRLLGAPAYLFRKLARDGWRGARFCLYGNAGGVAYEAGSVCAHIRLIVEAWAGRARGGTESVEPE